MWGAFFFSGYSQDIPPEKMLAIMMLAIMWEELCPEVGTAVHQVSVTLLW